MWIHLKRNNRKKLFELKSQKWNAGEKWRSTIFSASRSFFLHCFYVYVSFWSFYRFISLGKSAKSHAVENKMKIEMNIRNKGENEMHFWDLPKVAMNAKCFVWKRISIVAKVLFIHMPNNGARSRETNLISHKFTLCTM